MGGRRDETVSFVDTVGGRHGLRGKLRERKN